MAVELSPRCRKQSAAEGTSLGEVGIVRLWGRVDLATDKEPAVEKNKNRAVRRLDGVMNVEPRTDAK